MGRLSIGFDVLRLITPLGFGHQQIIRGSLIMNRQDLPTPMAGQPVMTLRINGLGARRSASQSLRDRGCMFALSRSITKEAQAESSSG